MFFCFCFISSLFLLLDPLRVFFFGIHGFCKVLFLFSSDDSRYFFFLQECREVNAHLRSPNWMKRHHYLIETRGDTEGLILRVRRIETEYVLLWDKVAELEVIFFSFFFFFFSWKFIFIVIFTRFILLYLL